MHDSPVRRPRLVATDLDGTLLRSDGAISPRTRAALRDVESAGIGVVFVTARPPRWLDPLADAVGGDGTVISANGAFDYDVRTRTVIASYPLERALLLEIVADLRAAVPGIGFSAELRDGVHTEPNYPELHPRWVPADLVPAPIDDLPPEAVVGKLLARTDHLPEEEVIPRVAEVLGDRALVQHSGTGGLAEISAPGVTKAAGLVRWCGRADIRAEDVWAFGDMPNDIPMLEWAGVGWAVANAHPDVRAAATRTCASNDEDGVARTLEWALGL
ncbi:Cof-type HAD-IIB family hydrolase [Terrabacter sp. Root181]|uniref:Cof-type HAD-IIB family hydrolase n=1 Tax=Terrabacter sp. Root181 TaxID=1736484 RepID=UPI0007004729|nr:Cof-type HAD-IIB family hydrolase [Terrabacter sp. Root181]KRB48177.1 haloacid dehalogenase [Terrabacter sp. Root181]